MSRQVIPGNPLASFQRRRSRTAATPLSEVALPSEKMTGARDEGLVSLSQCGIKALRGPARSSQKGRGPMAKELEQISELESRKVAEASRETEWKQPSFLREMFLGNFRL